MYRHSRASVDSGRRNPMLRRTLPVLLSLACFAAPVAAVEGEAITIAIENDVLTGSDDSYSNGFSAVWVSANIAEYDDNSFVKQWSRLWDRLPYVGDPGYTTYVAWSIAHEMHTPDDITLVNPPLDDQPYAGVLFVNSTLYARSERWSHAWEMKLGTVGPSSRADSLQRDVHDFIDADEPMGWDTQLPDEVLVNFSYTSTYLWKEGDVGKRAQWRLLPVGNVSVGNYYTGAGVGMYGEVGWNLVDAFGGNSLREGLSAASTVGVGPVENWSVAFFGGVGVHAVGHYLPLDGTVFRDSRSVDSKPFVGSASLGSAVRKGNMVISLAMTYSTKAFDGQPKGAEYGTLSVSWYQ